MKKIAGLLGMLTFSVGVFGQSYYKQGKKVDLVDNKKSAAQCYVEAFRLSFDSKTVEQARYYSDRASLMINKGAGWAIDKNSF